MLTGLVLNVKQRDKERDLNGMEQGQRVRQQVPPRCCEGLLRLYPNSLPLPPSPTWPKVYQNVPDGNKPYPAGLGDRNTSLKATDVALP